MEIRGLESYSENEKVNTKHYGAGIIVYDMAELRWAILLLNGDLISLAIENRVNGITKIKEIKMDKKEVEIILKEIREENGESLKRLKDKCQWEHMPPRSVIKEWGDPRKWY